jgi:hypothetical protein
LVYLLAIHAYINEMLGSRSKIPSNKSRPHIHDVKFLALLEAPYLYDISRLRVKRSRKNQHNAQIYTTALHVSHRFFVSILILYFPVLPKKNSITVAGSCRPYPLWLTILPKNNFNISLTTAFSDSGLSVLPVIPRSLHIKCKAVYKYLLTCWLYFYFGSATEAVISVRYALMSKLLFFYNRLIVIYEVVSVAEETTGLHTLSIVSLSHYFGIVICC